jgi:hypothetical protein
MNAKIKYSFASRIFSILTVASSLTLAACLATLAPTVSGDGDYRGTATRFQALRRTCQRPGLLTLSVRSGVMYYRWENQFIQVSVLNNGTLSGSLPGVQLTGTHDGTMLQGDVTDGQCGLHFTVKRVGS